MYFDSHPAFPSSEWQLTPYGSGSLDAVIEQVDDARTSSGSLDALSAEAGSTASMSLGRKTTGAERDQCDLPFLVP